MAGKEAFLGVAPSKHALGTPMAVTRVVRAACERPFTNMGRSYAGT